MRITDRNPFEVLPTLLRQKQTVPDIFTEAEIEALCGLGGVDGPLMEIMFGTGARKGDCRRLQLKHFRPSDDPDKPDALIFLDGKGGKNSVGPIPRRTSPALAQLSVLEGLNADDHLWYSLRANEISRR